MERQYSILDEEILAQGENLKLSKYTYTDKKGTQKLCEVVGRRHMDKPSEPDCVGTLAVLRRRLKFDCLVLVKQYRPPLKAFTLELPAGLVHPDETPEQTAARELLEETGYTATNVKHISALTAMDPGLSNCTMKVITVEVNGEDPRNHSPVQKPADEESIEVVLLPIDSLLCRLKEYSDQGVIVDSRVYCFAIGLALGTTHGSKLNHHKIELKDQEE